MGKAKVDYSKGKIYRIVSDNTGEQYIGSTTMRLSQRLSVHKSDYSRWVEGKRKTKMTSFKIIESGNYSIHLVEAFPCESREALEARERHFIETTECVNKVIPTRTHKEYCRDNRQRYLDCKKKHYGKKRETILEKQKKYYEANRGSIKEYLKQYRQDNKEEIAEKMKQYYEANKKTLIDYHKRYREANKEAIAEKRRQRVACLCGGDYTLRNKSNHSKTRKHQAYLKTVV